MKLKATLFNGDKFEKEFKSLIMNRELLIVDGQTLYMRGDGLLNFEVVE
jgi:hypothetical protein